MVMMISNNDDDDDVDNDDPYLEKLLKLLKLLKLSAVYSEFLVASHLTSGGNSGIHSRRGERLRFFFFLRISA